MITEHLRSLLSKGFQCHIVVTSKLVEATPNTSKLAEATPNPTFYVIKMLKCTVPKIAPEGPFTSCLHLLVEPLTTILLP